MSMPSYEDKTQRPAEEVPFQVYLDSLSPQDRTNVEQLVEVFRTMSEKVRKKMALIAIGKSVASSTRGTQRKDLDFLIIQEGGASFRDIKALAIVVSETTGIPIGEVTEPFLDLELGIPAHNGSIQLKPNPGTPLELIPSTDSQSVDRQLKRMRSAMSSSTLTRDFSILVQS